ncbi:hypothetical protein WJX72_008971 [[Myrmecia] bisecta]|uniref:Uncharacterized protein n=1 Tax=[Myrmecia] bisecta TaxID=41462 RepID=A0AAW1QG24_9CHLO
MGFFGPGKANRISKKKVEVWTREEVHRWLAAIGMTKYEEQFKAVSGKRLLQLSAADLYTLVATKLEADLFLDAIQELRDRERNAGTPSRTSSFLSGSRTSQSGNPLTPASVSSTTNKRPPLPTTPPSASATLTEIKTKVPAAKGPADSTDLAHLMGGLEMVSELGAYLAQIGVQGSGLMEASQRSPMVGHIIGALWELHELAQGAKGNRANCLQISTFGEDIMRVFEAAGKRLAFIDSHALGKVLTQVEKAIALVDHCANPGWLQRMATEEKSVEDFVSIHNAILEVLKEAKVDTLATGRVLTFGDYHDASRPLRRCLKQLGSGSLEEGFQKVRQEEAALAEVATLIGVDKQVVLADLETPGLMPTRSSDRISSSGGDSPMTPLGQNKAKEYQNVFNTYDKNKSGALELEELRDCLADLGMLDGVKQTELDSVVAQQFMSADLDGDSKISFEEFCQFYQQVSLSKARNDLRAKLGMTAEKDLKKMFCSFASFGVRQHLEEMDGARFSKLVRECGLLDKALTTIDADIIFAKVKVKGQRKINFEQFLKALGIAADKKGAALEDVVKAILLAGGPAASGTKADYVKFHDDKSTYTGVYARGGPTNVEPSNDLSALLDRSDADVRGVPLRKTLSISDPPLSARGPMSPAGSACSSPHYAHSPHYGSSTVFSNPGNLTARTHTPPSGSMTARAHTPGGSMTARAYSPSSGSMTARGSRPSSPWAENAGSADLPAIFRAYCTFGAGATSTLSPKPAKLEMDGARFAKLCRESGLLGGKLNSIAIDIIFSKAKAKGARKISYKEFEAALALVAEEKGCSQEEVQQSVLSAGGPRRNAMQAGNVRLHDDKSTYTGVYAKGGPQTVDKRITLESLTDRTNTQGKRMSM